MTPFINRYIDAAADSIQQGKTNNPEIISGVVQSVAAGGLSAEIVDSYGKSFPLSSQPGLILRAGYQVTAARPKQGAVNATFQVLQINSHDTGNDVVVGPDLPPLVVRSNQITVVPPPIIGGSFIVTIREVFELVDERYNPIHYEFAAISQADYIALGRPHAEQWPIHQQRPHMPARAATLAQAVTSTQTTLTLVEDVSSWAEQGQVICEQEVMTFTARVGHVLTVVRGTGGSVAVAHNAQVAVRELRNVVTTMTQSCSQSDLVIHVQDTSSFGGLGGIRFVDGSGETALYDSLTSNTFVINAQGRGYNGSTASPHASGCSVMQSVPTDAFTQSAGIQLNTPYLIVLRYSVNYNSTTFNGDWTPIVVLTGVGDTTPPAATIPTMTQVGRNFALNCAPVGDTDLAFYEYEMRGHRQTANTYDIFTPTIRSTTTNATWLLPADPVGDHYDTFQVHVRTVDTSNNTLGYSSWVDATMDVTPPPVPTGVIGGFVDNHNVNTNCDPSPAPDFDHFTIRFKQGTTVLATLDNVRTGYFSYRIDYVFGSTFYVAYRAVDVNGNASAYSADVALTFDSDPPPTPTGTGAAFYTNTYVACYCDLSPEPDALFYYYRIKDNGNVVQTVPSNGNRPWAAAGVTFIQGHSYTVASAVVDLYGNQSLWSSEVAVTVPANPPAVPTGLAATLHSDGIQVTWSANTEGSLRDYQVGITVDTNSELVFQSVHNNFWYGFDPPSHQSGNNHSYSIRVRARDWFFNASAYCTPVVVTFSPPATPTGQTGQLLSNNAGISLSCNAQPDAAAYNWSIKRDGVEIAQWQASDPVTTYLFGPGGQIPPSTGYTVAVQAVGSGGLTSAFTNYVNVGLDTTAPAVPTGLARTLVFGGAKLSCTKNPEYDVRAYGWKVLIDGSTTDTLPETGRPFTFYQFPKDGGNHTYQFAVRAIDYNNNASAYSGYVPGSPDGVDLGTDGITLVNSASSGAITNLDAIATVNTANSGADWAAVVTAIAPDHRWQLNLNSNTQTDTGAATAANITLSGTVTKNVTGLLPNAGGKAITFDGSTGYGSTPAYTPPATSMTYILLVKNTATAGRLATFADATPTAATFDRELSITATGKINDYIYPGNGATSLTSAKSINDGKGHIVIVRVDGVGHTRDIWIDSSTAADASDTNYSMFGGYASPRLNVGENCATTLQELMVVHRAITNTEIANLCAAFHAPALTAGLLTANAAAGNSAAAAINLGSTNVQKIDGPSASAAVNQAGSSNKIVNISGRPGSELPNADMENYNTGGDVNLPDYWSAPVSTGTATGTVSYLKDSSVNVQSGSYDWAITATKTGGIGSYTVETYSDYVPVATGFQYTINAFVGVSGSGGSAGVYVKWYDRNKAYLSSSTLYSTIVAWGLQTKATSPANAAYARVVLVTTGTITSTAVTAYWDYVDFRYAIDGFRMNGTLSLDTLSVTGGFTPPAAFGSQWLAPTITDGQLSNTAITTTKSASEVDVDATNIILNFTKQAGYAQYATLTLTCDVSATAVVGYLVLTDSSNVRIGKCVPIANTAKEQYTLNGKINIPAGSGNYTVKLRWASDGTATLTMTTKTATNSPYYMYTLTHQ